MLVPSDCPLRTFRPSPYPTQCSPCLPVQSVPLCSAPTCWWCMQAQGVPVRHVICGFYLFMYLFFLPVLLPSEIPKPLTDPLVRVFPDVWKLLPFLDSLPRMDLRPYLFCLSFYLLYFFLPSFKDNGLLFWVPDVLCQHSEVVLWTLISFQMFF